MKVSSAALLLLIHAVSAREQQPTVECCLCGDGCAEVAPEKVDLLTVSPEGTLTTCEEIALDLLDNSQEVDEDVCAKVRYDYQEACCSAGKS